MVVLAGGFVSSAWILTLIILQIEVGSAHIGWVTGLMYTVKNVGGAIGSTTYTNNLSARFVAAIPSKFALPLAESGLDPTLIPAVLQALTSGATTSPILAKLTPAQLGIAALGITQSYAYAFKIVFLISIAYGITGIFFTALTKPVQFTNEVDMQPASMRIKKIWRSSTAV